MLYKNIFCGDVDIGLLVYIDSENDFFVMLDFYVGSLWFIKVFELFGLVLIMDKNNVEESSK